MSSQLYGQPGPSHRISHPERTGCGGLSSSLHPTIPRTIPRQSGTIRRDFFILFLRFRLLKSCFWTPEKVMASKCNFQDHPKISTSNQFQKFCNPAPGISSIRIDVGTFLLIPSFRIGSGWEYLKSSYMSKTIGMATILGNPAGIPNPIDVLPGTICGYR